ncbi:KxYKxGKxW signal peptide domain-containing protein [Xylocopilactobacillus apicola]|uniref:Elongation factor 1 beta central acidic region eukaryote domain-containing protein n=1 Tax=Xylocopilactobacillus apicola TaxID=2932184 RepID=A0AAU9DB46_9LACO|nr:KxYKxGKxW signal peptide domain-containing protein [Xylocopilactobacillus apicola]BDR59705.1 hypothetical protein XA3_21460 [Xylocopilactobacillus apicola]
MRFKNQKNRLMDEKVHYKMYKAGKHWLVAGITTFGFFVSIGLGSTLTKADDTSKNVTQITATSNNLTTSSTSAVNKGNSLMPSFTPNIINIGPGKDAPVIGPQLTPQDGDTDYTPASEFTWQYNADGTAYMKKFNGQESRVNIPPKIVNPKDGQTYTVTRIDGNYGGFGDGVNGTPNGLINNSRITSLVVPGTVKTLYAGTIGTLPNLVSFTLSEGVTSISQSIKELGPSNVNENFWEIFWACPKLTYLYLPTTLTGLINPGNIISTLVGHSESPLTHFTNVDYVFKNYKHLYSDNWGQTEKFLTDFTDINYHIPDKDGYLKNPDVVQWTRTNGTRLPVTISNVQNATYDSNRDTFKINPGMTSIKYTVTIDLSSLGVANKTINVTLPIFLGNIQVKDYHYSVGDTFSAANNFTSGRSAVGGVLAWNDPAVKAVVTDSKDNPVALDQITKHDGEYKIKYVYTYGFDQKTYTSDTAKITVGQTNNIKVSLVATNTNQTLKTDAVAPGTPKTGDTLDLSANSSFLSDIIPNGYHYSTTDELKGKVQPNSPKYGPVAQSLTVYITGDKVQPTDTNAVTVHYYLRKPDNTPTTIPVKKDRQIGGNIGDTITVNPGDPEQAAPAGYTIVPNQKSDTWTLQVGTGHEVIYYYTANQYDNITIHFTDVTTGDPVEPTYTPTGHHTGDELDIIGKDVAGHLPPGYHVAKEDELKDKDGNKVEQPKNPSYTDQKQDPAIWVIGDTIGKDDANALIIHHMMKDKDGKDVPVPTMPDIKKGGRVGQTIKVQPTKAAAGYTLDPASQETSYTFDPKKPGEITFYYTANQYDNIHIHFTDVTTGKEVTPVYTPTGHHTGDTIDIVDKDVAGHLPPGYHVAKEDELKDKNGNKVEQPKNPSYTDQKQDPAVWVIGDTIGKDDANALIIHHMMKDKDGKDVPVPTMPDIKQGGRVGQTINVKPTKAAAGYTLDPTSQAVNYTFKPKDDNSKPGEITFYYTADQNDNIHIHFTDVTTGDEVTPTYTPTGHHTGDTIDIVDKDVAGHLPPGYHVAKEDELKDKNGNKVEQPKNPSYTDQKQDPAIWVIGDTIGKDDANALIIHHMMKDKDGKDVPVPTMPDIKQGGRVGQTINVKPTKAAAGYTLDPTSQAVNYTFKPKDDNSKPGEITFYYTADQNDNIHIHFTDVTTGDEVTPTYTPTGHHTGDTIDIVDKDVAGHLPPGYHVAKEDELKDKNGNKVEQPKNPSYTDQKQDPAIWVIGDTIGKDDANALIIHHMMKDKDGKDVPVPTMPDIKQGGRVGQTINVKPTKAAAGYTLDPTSQAVDYTFKPKDDNSKPGEITFYYTADQNDNIHIHFTDVTTGDPVEPTYTPTGHHTGDTIDIVDKDVAGHLPPGYHVAKEDELKDKNGNKVEQPKNPSYTDQKQDPAVWVIGDTIGKDDANALIIHHMMKDKDGKDVPVPTMPDIKQGGRVGQTINVKPTKAAAGYTLDPTSQAVDYTFKPKDDNSKPGEITFYYTADQNDNIHIHFTDVTTGDEVTPTYTPTGHHTGDTIDIVDKDVAGHLPPGYHVAKEDELKDKNGNKVEQPKNPSYTDQKQDPAIWVIGDTIGKDDANALIIHHMMKDKDGKDVPVPTMPDIKQGGRVGQTINVKPTKAAAGYTLDPTSQAVDYTFKPKDDNSKPGEITFYYTADQNDNIHIHFTDVTTGDPVEPTYTPTGHHTGDTIDIVDKDVAGHLPPGYHVAKEDELKDKNGNKVEQPKNPSYTDQKQDPAVWVIGDTIGKDDANALIIHHMMKDKDGKDVPVPTMPDIKQGGRVGQTINVKPTKAAAGYTLDPTSQAVDYTFKPKDDNSKPGEITFYYTADQNDNIHIHFTDVTTGDPVEPTYTPTGHHTGDTIDIVDKDVAGHLPPGYHVAKEDELKDKNGNKVEQPKNPSYTDQKQDPAIWVIGDDIGENDSNSLIIHHYIKDKKDAKGKPVKVPGMDDIKKGGRVGQILPVQPTQAVPGYSIANGENTINYTFKPKTDNSKPGEIAFYYTANTQTNITVDFVNINGAGKDIVGHSTPQNHFTGDELDLSNDPEIKSAVPNGYQLATDPELKDKGLTRPVNPTYGPQAPTENPIVYVVGKETTASNALTVHHKIKGPNNTETNVPGMPDITMNGRVGETIKVQPTAPIAGYTLSSESKETAYKFKPDSTGDITFYYTAKEQSNVTINFVNAKNGKTVKTDSPKGKTGDTLDLTSKTAGSYIDNTLKQTGYHYAENGELNGNKQPDKNLEFSTTPQTQTVYVAGDVVDGTSHASSRVTVHHYLKGTTKNVPRMTDTYKGGIIGDNVTVSPDDPEQKAPAGYTIVPNQQPDTWELTADGGHEVTYYYTADSIDNISIQFVNASDPTKKVGMPYIPSGHVTGDNLKVDSDEVKGHVPAGYHVASKAELDDLGSSLTQPELVYGVTSGVQTVYVIGEAQSNITVHFLDAKTLKELGTVTPKENPDSNSNPKASYRTGDVLKLDAASNYVSDFINAHTGYSYTSNSELSSMNLKQPENPTYTTQSQDINVYLSPQSKATHILKVIHKEQLPSTRGVRGLKDFQTSIEEGSDYDFDINDSAHKAPRGYTLIPGQESKLKGTMGTDGKEIILYYAKIR